MQDVESKLNSNNPTTIAVTFSKIVHTVKEKHEQGIKDGHELKFLKEKCLSLDPLVSEVAGASIRHLLEANILHVDSILPDFITAIPVTKCYFNLINILGDLLSMENCNKPVTYNLCAPQHPFITVLVENPKTWNFVVNKIKSLTEQNTRETIDRLCKPVYLFCICNPKQNDLLDLCNQRLWNFLLSLNSQTNFYNILCWLQIQGRTSLESTKELLNEALFYVQSHKSSINTEILILWQISLLYYLALHKCDLHSSINCLKNILREFHCMRTKNCQLLMLAKILDICSPVYLYDLLNICKLLVYEGGANNFYVLKVLEASLLCWLANPCLLINEATKVANIILKYIESNDPPKQQSHIRNFLSEYYDILSVNRDVFFSLKTYLIFEEFENESLIINWVQKFKNVPDEFVLQNFHILCGLFLINTNNLLFEELFSIILRCTYKHAYLTSKLLTLILYKISHTKEPKQHFQLLKALPKMVILKDNTPIVVATLQALSKGSTDLFNCCLSLMFEVWKVDRKCYMYLENMLMQESFSNKKREFEITKTYIIKKICETKPELHGKDMVAHLSKILNECNHDNGSLPSALALEAIRILCKVEIIDIVTTWSTLQPKFEKDKRIPVIKGLCSLIQQVPELPYTQNYVDMQKDVIKKLWEYTELGNPETTEAALNSLSRFTLEQISDQIPEKYLDEVLPQTSGGIYLVPGSTWIKFLKENNASKEAVNFLIKIMSSEIDAYLKYVYQVKGTREPTNYSYLPTHSIVRGIGEYVRGWASKWRSNNIEELYIACLKILSVEYSKPLPPLDWCFLQELIHDFASKDLAIDIAAHQVMLSGTARRLMENYISAVTQQLQTEDVLNIWRNLKHLGNSIQPITLKPFVELSYSFAIDQFIKHNDELLKYIVDITQSILKNDNIQDINKVVIAQVLNDRISITNVNSELFNILLPAIIEVPIKSLNEICQQINTSDEWIAKLVKIQCSVAANTEISPLTWLNSIIDIKAKTNRDLLFLNDFQIVFQKHINNAEECAMWLLELIGQIEAKIVDRSDENEISFYFEILIFTVVQFSGYNVLLTGNNDFKTLFPQACASLLDNEKWSICTSQILEWLYYMNREQTVNKEYRKTFGLTLQSLRHDDEFMKQQRWMKYLSCNTQFD